MFLRILCEVPPIRPSLHQYLPSFLPPPPIIHPSSSSISRNGCLYKQHAKVRPHFSCVCRVGKKSTRHLRVGHRLPLGTGAREPEPAKEAAGRDSSSQKGRREPGTRSTHKEPLSGRLSVIGRTQIANLSNIKL